MKTRIQIAWVICALVGIFAAPGAWACECMAMTPDEFATEAAVLFEGRLLRNEPLRSTPTELEQVLPGLVEGVFRVEQVYKGELGIQVHIRYWPADAHLCGTSFSPNRKMIVAAYAYPGIGYVTDGCFRLYDEAFRSQVLEAVRRQLGQSKVGTESE